MGTSEKTELDAHFESLSDRAECTKSWTEKLLKNTEAVLTPNPGNRAEDFIFEKIEKKKPVRLSNLEYLGLDMIEVSKNETESCSIIAPLRLSKRNIVTINILSNQKAGSEFGQEGAYGSALIKVGQSEQKLGQIERDFHTAAENCFVQPLRRFLEGEMRTITREKGILESKR